MDGLVHHEIEPVMEVDALSISNRDSEPFEPDDPILDDQLIRLIRTSAGSELFVNSVSQEMLKVGQMNWGDILSAAPDALGRLGQCFVLASDPVASSLVLPESAGLPYKSLGANLVHCSDLARHAFRDAEAGMKKVSLIAQAVSEPHGTIDMMIEAVEDHDLAEIALPDQLSMLKQVSNECIQSTLMIKEKFEIWSQFSNAVYKACVDLDQTTRSRTADLNLSVEGKRLAAQMKQQRAEMTRAELRHDWYRVAQQVRFDAETKLNQRLEEELKTTEEFNSMQLKLRKLLASKVTMAHVKDIVGDCVMHLQAFCNKLNDLNSFFIDMKNYVERIDKDRVDKFQQTAKVTRGLASQAEAAATDTEGLIKEKIAQRQLDQVRIHALDVKGRYLVTQAMANIYVEISARHVIPGVEKIDRLSLPNAKGLSPEERAREVLEVGSLAKMGRRDVELLANAKRDQFLKAISDNRGDIEDIGKAENNLSKLPFPLCNRRRLRE